MTTEHKSFPPGTDYVALLTANYKAASERDWNTRDSRLEFLGSEPFCFTTYDGEMDAMLAGKALEVCRAVTEGKTFECIEDPANYCWYLLLCDTHFFAGSLDWGTSIRGAYWDYNVHKIGTFTYSHDEGDGLEAHVQSAGLGLRVTDDGKASVLESGCPSDTPDDDWLLLPLRWLIQHHHRLKNFDNEVGVPRWVVRVFLALTVLVDDLRSLTFADVDDHFLIPIAHGVSPSC